MAPASAVLPARPRRRIRAAVALVAAAATALAGVTLVAPAAPAQAAGAVDQSNEQIGGRGTYSMWGGSGITQQFVAGAAGSVDAVDVYLGAFFGPSASQLTVTVAVEVAGVRGPTVTITPTPSAWNHVELPSASPIAAGAVGRIVVRSVGPSNSGITVPNNDGYGPASSLHPAAFDISFRTYLVPAVAPHIEGATPDALLGRDYASTLLVSGSPTPAVRVSAGALPPGITLSTTGVLSGRPTQVGDFAFTVEATNVGGSATLQGAMSVRDPLPTPPQDLRFEYRGGAVVVSWSPPASLGTGTFQHYEISTSLPIPSFRTTDTSLAYELGLGESAQFSVTVVTSEGTGPAATATATYIVPPSEPLGITAQPQGDQAIAVRWDAPAESGGSPVQSYVVQYRGNSTTWTTAPASAVSGTSALITGLSPSFFHQFRVAAVTAGGQGAFSALAYARPITLPSAPTLGTVTSGDGAVQLAFTAPSSDGGSPITAYRVERLVAGSWVTLQEAPGQVSGATVRIEGLVNGEVHTLRVVAVNAAGTGAPSAQASIVPSRVADAPGSLAIVPGDGRVDVSWTAPADGGAAITGYAVEVQVAGGAWSPVAPSRIVGTTASVDGLVNGTSVAVRVAAINARGTGPWSSISATPRTVPDAPAVASATPGDGAVTLDVEAPASDGGDPVTGYVVQQRIAGGAWAAPVEVAFDDASAVISGLANGVAVELRVAAQNAAGVGAWSTVVSVTPRTVPDAPTGLSVEARDAAVWITWAPPAFDGGAAIDAWRVEMRADGGAWRTIPVVVYGGRRALVDGLSNGVAYEVRVSVGNAAGFGAPSDVVSATPFTLPEAPTALAATPGDASVQLAWSAPTFDGGADVTSYAVELRPEGTDEWIVSNAVSLDGTTASVGGLENGVAYELRVAAINPAGRGPWVQASSTPRTVPDAPTAVTASPRSGGMAVTWEAPGFDGGAALGGYVLEIHRWGDRTELEEPVWIAPESVTFDGASAIVDGLVDGAAYSVRIAAVTVAGQGAWSEPASATPRSLPGAPVDLLAFPSSGRVQLTWAPPVSDGGAAIEGWAIEHRVVGDDAWTTPTDTEGTQNLVTVLGLDDGTAYEFRVAASNAAGTGPWSAVASATPTGLADAVQGLAATPGDRRVELSWDAPQWDGGTPVLEYRVLVSTELGTPVLPQVVVDGTTAVVTGLENGTPIVLTVVAVNANGWGTAAGVSTTPFAFVPTILGPDGSEVDGSTLRAGDELVVRASDLPAGAEAVVELHSTPIVLGRGIVDANGDLAVTVTIPEGVTPGEHEIVVRLLDAGAEVAPIRVPVTIAAPIVTPPVVEPPVVQPPAIAPVAPAPVAVAPAAAAPSAGGAGQLPRTGLDTLLPMLLLGAALLLVGAAARRRSARR